MNGETSGAEGGQNSNTRVQPSSSGDQTTRKRVTLNYPEMAAPSTPERSRGPYPSTPAPTTSQCAEQARGAGPSTSTPTTSWYAAASPTLSPLNPFSEDYSPPSSPGSGFCGTTPENSPASQRLFTSYVPETPASTHRGEAAVGAQQSGSVGLKKAKFPELFSGTKSDLQDYLRHFEIVSRMNGWSEEEMGPVLASSLRGSAQQVLGDLPPGEMENFQAILRALKRRFDPDGRESLRKSEFRARIKRKNESVSEYGFALNRLATSAFPKMTQEAREDLIIDQFILGLPTTDMQGHVELNKPATIDKAIALATQFESFHGRHKGRKPEDKASHSNLPEKPVRLVDKAKEDDKVLKELQGVREATQGLKEAMQGVKEAMQMLTNRQGNRPPPPPPINPRPAQPPINPRPARRDMPCFNCGDPAHLWRECPHPPLSGNRNQQWGAQNRSPPQQKYPQQNGSGSGTTGARARQPTQSAGQRSEN